MGDPAGAFVVREHLRRLCVFSRQLGGVALEHHDVADGRAGERARQNAV